MVYLEKIERGSKTYYYLTKNFRVSGQGWKKLRKYVGGNPPSKEQTKKAIEEIEADALKKGLLKPLSKYAYLSDEEAEKLQDLKEVFNEWRGKLSAVEKRKYEEDFVVRFTYNSNAIEGNRLSLRETSMILTENMIPAGVAPNDYNEAVNSKHCYEFMKRYAGEFNQKFLLKIHELLTRNTDCEIVGSYRDYEVRISGSEWIPPTHKKVREEMRKVFQWYYSARKKLHPVELGSILHNKLVRVHPFADGNGRTSRVVMNWILMKNEFPMFYIELRDKMKYYEAVEEGDKGNDEAIVHYVARVLMEQLSQKVSGPNL
ncbi:MAG: Fic family protein [Methanocellales archaeon]|nr:Fic family protein [Methanocellales archaeon]MDD3291533.1 Fic family protein [Methanocellales archaeon]MDD5235923.1 Fic family protein [Methanocellales archaeon]MDD5485315.1 Fic family protein [Methanocellales archaeon]